MTDGIRDDVATTTDALPLTGGCRCGAIRYEIAALPDFAVSCHCRACQYDSGGGPAHAIVVAPAALSIRQGEPKRFEYPSATSGEMVFRSFCPDCGTPLFGGSSGADYISVKAGSLDDPENFRPRAQIWTASAPSWHPVEPDIPSFTGNMEL